MFHCGVWK